MSSLAASHQPVARRSLRSFPTWTLGDAFARWRRGGETVVPVTGPIGVFLDAHRDGGGAWKRFAEPLPVALRRGSNGAIVLTMTTAADARTRRPTRAITPGHYRGRIVADRYQVRRFVQDLSPGARASFELLPGFAYPFPRASMLMRSAPEGGSGKTSIVPGGPTLLRGTVRRVDGRGLARARVYFLSAHGVRPFDRYRTDATGHFVLVVADDAFGDVKAGAEPTLDVVVGIRVSGRSGAPEQVEVPVTRGCDTAVVQASLRGVVCTEGGAPIAGATVGVVGRPPIVTTAADGRWTYCFGFAEPNGSVTVRITPPHGAPTSVEVAVVTQTTKSIPPIIVPKRD
jgi:hypothetical protein